MQLIIDQLVAQGVTDFFLAPGSRSTPLALSAARHPKATVYSHFDERALGFYALGTALAKEAPVAVIVTSGTAVGNLFPAAMEACHASIPLLFLTADRPPELQATSANQTADQSKLFGGFVRFQLSVDQESPKQAIRSQIAQAVFRSQFPHPGPVQLNCPFREPLYPLAEEERGKAIQLETSSVQTLPMQTLPSKGMILLGRLPERGDVAAVLTLARELKWPVFADLLSSARCSPSREQIRHFDWLFGQKLPVPEAVLHFGERLTSKRLMQWLTENKVHEYVHISPYTHWVDPSHLVTKRLASPIRAACSSIRAEPSPGWLELWQEMDVQVGRKLEGAFGPGAPLTESLAMHRMNKGARGFVFLGNSMPIREADWFLFPQETKAFFCNRGLSGIDGNIATAAGLSSGLKAPLLAVVGDLTALHDLNSLALIRKAKDPITLVISNNHGGGIFSHLAVAKDPLFEELFGFEHELGFAEAAKMFSLPYRRAATVEEFERALEIEESCVIELISCRKTNAAFHKELKEQCSSPSSMVF